MVDLAERTIEGIVEHPEMFKISEYVNKSREAFSTRHTTMFYRKLSDTIEIAYFWGNFDNPEKIKELLKFK